MAKYSTVNKPSSAVKPEQIRLGKPKQREQELSSPVCYAGSPELRPEFQDLDSPSTAPELKDEALEDED